MKTDSAQIQYDKMTKTPVNKLVLQLGLPTTVSMLVTSVYNMADTFFVSQLGTSVSGATGVVFALMAIINAFGFMFGHGAGSNISRKLGAHDVESARKFASTSFFLSLLCGALICILGFLFHAPFMRLLGSTDSILPHAIEYSTWILIAAPAMASSCVMNNILRYEGKAFFAMLGLAWRYFKHLRRHVPDLRPKTGSPWRWYLHRYFPVHQHGHPHQPIPSRKSPKPPKHPLRHPTVQRCVQHPGNRLSKPDAPGT